MRPPGRRFLMYAASRLDCGEPAGRGPSLTWYSSIDQARSSLKRSTFAAGAAAGCSPVVAGSAAGAGSSPLPQAARASAQTRALIVAGDRLQEVGEALTRGLTSRRDMLRGYVVRFVIAQNPARDGLAMHLVGPVVEPRGA